MRNAFSGSMKIDRTLYFSKAFGRFCGCNPTNVINIYQLYGSVKVTATVGDITKSVCPRVGD